MHHSEPQTLGGWSERHPACRPAEPQGRRHLLADMKSLALKGKGLSGGGFCLVLGCLLLEEKHFGEVGQQKQLDFFIIMLFFFPGGTKQWIATETYTLTRLVL